ncbi:MAG TPA: response regulator [Solirubrobacteraceae bacterium]|jgi:CheY-like chemotaxis protein
MIQRRTGPVLVVDDHPLSCRLLERILEFEGYTTLVASSIAEAEMLVLESLPSLIVVDVRLPDGSGLDLARRLKLSPPTWRCTILACSAGATAGDRTRALRAGCDDYVAKPIEIGSFVRLVSKFAAPDRTRQAPAVGVRQAPLPKAL